MPAILEKDSETAWLDLSVPASDARQLLRPSDENVIKAHTIGPLITSRTADRNTAELIKPWNYTQQLLF